MLAPVYKNADPDAVDELSQPSIRISRDENEKYKEGVNNYSPFMGLSADPFPITIPTLGEKDQVRTQVPYVVD